MELHLHNSASKSPVGHETRDAAVRPIVLIGAGLALTVAMVGGIAYGLFHYLSAHQTVALPANPMAAFDSQIPPEPRIEDHPAIEIQQLHAEEERTLSTYGWVDKKAGIVRIPIDLAIKLQLQRGFPARKETTKK